MADPYHYIATDEITIGDRDYQKGETIADEHTGIVDQNSTLQKMTTRALTDPDAAQ